MTTFIHYSLFWLGFQFFRITNKTLSYPYYSFRKLFVITRGKLNDTLSARLTARKGKYQLPSHAGVLGNLQTNDVAAIVSAINRDGFYVFDTKLGDDLIKQLTDFASTHEARLIPPAPDGTRVAHYDSKKPISPRYEFDEAALMENPVVQDLITDYSLLSVAQGYLGVKPIQDLTTMWWSTTFSKEASSAAAQLYHFDMDRIKFLKFFFYLTDVTTETGPHCYVRASHRNLPENLWKDGRIADNEIFSAFKKDDLVEIAGVKGSIIAVDTRGLHKGKALQKGERLILQFEFANSLFGAPFENINLQNKLTTKALAFFKKYTYTFQRFGF